MESSYDLFWKQPTWPALVALGFLVTIMVAALCVGRGFDVGYAVGVQTLETGQAQLVPVDGPITSYFMVRALAEQISGVESTSARFDFDAVLTLETGESVRVHVRACNFIQEQYTTNLGDRVTPTHTPLGAGIVLPASLGRAAPWSEALGVRLTPLVGGVPGLVVPVAGWVTQAPGAPLSNTAYLDLESARHFFGTVGATSIVLRLRAGLDADGWFGTNQDFFRNSQVRLIGWRTAARNRFVASETLLAPVNFWIGSILAATLLGCLAIGVRSRRPRSGLVQVLRGAWSVRCRGLIWLFAGGACGGTLVLCLALLAGPIVAQSLASEFPFLGPPELLWNFDGVLLGLPLATLVGTFTIALAPPLPLPWHPR